MMKRPLKSVLLATCLACGCGRASMPPAMPPAPTPLSVDAWHELPVHEKYDESTFSRLRSQDPKLDNDRAWHRFMIETVIPARKRDLPDDLPN